MPTGLSVGELAMRTGTTISALRFYEREGLLHPTRTAGNQRHYRRTDIHRMALVRATRRAGWPVSAIRTLLRRLPTEREPTTAEWTQVLSIARDNLDTQIAWLRFLAGMPANSPTSRTVERSLDDDWTQ